MREILSLGDSLVACGRQPDDLASLGNGFVADLAGACPTYRFLNGGYNGARLVDVNFYLLETLTACQDLAGVILWVGINDLGRQAALSEAGWNSFVSSWQGQYSRLLDFLQDQAGPDLPILVLAPVAKQATSALLDLIQALDGLGPRPGLTQVNPNSWLQAEDFMPDGIHLKPAGQEQVANHLLDWVSRLT